MYIHLHSGNEAVRCPALSSLPNGRIIYNSSRLDGGYPLHTRANFECHRGYYEYYSGGGGEWETCDYPIENWMWGSFQGYWSGQTPICNQSKGI